MTPKFFGTVTQGNMRLEDREAFILWIGQFEGKQISVTVSKKKRVRSTGKAWEKGNQNGYYWATVLAISAKDLGYTVDEMHEVFTEMYAPVTFKDFGEQRVKCRIRSSKMDTVQFTEYVETIRMKMAEMNCIIPDPTIV